MVTRTKKIFVGGLSAQTTLDDVRAYFEQFGLIEDAMLMFDKQTNRHRGEFHRLSLGAAEAALAAAAAAAAAAAPSSINFESIIIYCATLAGD